MKLITVAGTSSNVGKTTICEMLIRYLSNNNADNIISQHRYVSALKITTRHKGICFSGACGVCDSIKYPYVIKEDSVAIDQSGKDTSRLKEAGARKVIWLLSYPETLTDGVASALNRFEKDGIVVIEGNSFLTVHDADIAILVARPSYTELKMSAKIILDKIDITIINKDKNTSSTQIRNVQDWLKKTGNMAATVIANPILDDPMFLQDILAGV